MAWNVRDLCFKQALGREGSLAERLWSANDTPFPSVCLSLPVAMAPCTDAAPTTPSQAMKVTTKEPVFLAGRPLLLHSQRLLKCGLGASGWPGEVN